MAAAHANNTNQQAQMQHSQKSILIFLVAAVGVMLIWATRPCYAKTLIPGASGGLRVISQYKDASIFINNKFAGTQAADVYFSLAERSFIRVARYACRDTVVEIRTVKQSEPYPGSYILPILFGDRDKKAILARVNDAGEEYYIIDPFCKTQQGS